MRRLPVLMVCALVLCACDSQPAPPPVTNTPDPAKVGTPVAEPGAVKAPAAAPTKADPAKAAPKTPPASGKAGAPATPPPSGDAAAPPKEDVVPEEWRKKLELTELDKMYPPKGREDMNQLRADVKKARSEMKPGGTADELTGELEEMLTLLAETIPSQVAAKKHADARQSLMKAFKVGHEVTSKNLARMHAVVGKLKPGETPSGPGAEDVPTFSNNARAASSLMGFAAQGLFVYMHSGELDGRKEAFTFMIQQYKLMNTLGKGDLTPPKPGESPFRYIAAGHAANIGALLWIAQGFETDAAHKAAMQAELEKLGVSKTLPAAAKPGGAQGPPPGMAPPGGPGGAPPAPR